MQELFPAFGMDVEIDAVPNMRYNSTRTGAFDPLRIHNARYLSTPTSQGVKSFMYVFSVLNESRNPVSAFIPFDQASNEENILINSFNRYIPLTDEQGRLVTNMGVTYPWNIISIVNGQNASLAWEFVSQYLIPASLCHDTTNEPVPITSLWWGRPNLGYYSFDAPILRKYTREHLADVIDVVSSLSWEEITLYIDNDGYLQYQTRTIWGGVPLAGIRDADLQTRVTTIDSVINRVEMLNERPMSPLPLVPFELFEPTILSMLRQTTSPEEAARRIHFAVEYWLSE